MDRNYKKMEKEYNALCAAFGVKSGLWYSMYHRFSTLVFCDANKKAIIAEYLALEDFVERAKKVDFIYYYGIDDFLREYKNAVYRCLNL